MSNDPIAENNTMRELTAADAGCWIDGHHGQYATPMMLRIATERGWDGLDEAERDYMMRWINTQQQNDDYGTSMEERLIEAQDEAEAWLNEHVAPEGYSFGWYEGEFFLWSDAEWEEES